MPHGVFVVEASGREFAQLVGALGTSRGLASGLDGRQKQGDKHANDGDYHQKFDEGESGKLGPT
jgi:hypothetical protein